MDAKASQCKQLSALSRKRALQRHCGPNYRTMRKLNGGVFVWKNYRVWRPTILRLLKEVIDKRVLAEVKVNPPKYFVADDLTWLETAIKKVTGTEASNIKLFLKEQLPKQYPFIRAFHGCRPVTIDSYSKHGIRPCNP